MKQREEIIIYNSRNLIEGFDCIYGHVRHSSTTVEIL